MKKKKKRVPKSLEVAAALQRKLAMQAGYYDGRFKEKVIKNKKKELEKRRSKKRYFPED